jgi:8-oxo-dGTP pyrophosphatase MutT (NUDIX family)
VIRRAVRADPGHGRLALPGGFIDVNDESWQHAAAREVWEETGIRLPPEGFREFAVRSAPDKTLLLFVTAPAVPASDLPTFNATGETSEMVVITGPRDLAFPLHTQVARSRTPKPECRINDEFRMTE